MKNNLRTKNVQFPKQTRGFGERRTVKETVSLSISGELGKAEWGVNVIASFKVTHLTKAKRIIEG